VLGGGEAHLRQLAAALVAAGDSATVITRRGEAAWPARDEIDGIRVLRVAPAGPSRTGKYLMLPFAVRAALRELQRHDLLVVRATRVLGLPGLVAARLAGRPVVLQPEINGELDGSAFTWGKPWAERAAGRLVRRVATARNLWLRDADAFVAMSRRIRDEIVGAGVGPERVAWIAHAVDTGRFRPAGADERVALRRALGLPAGVIATYTGRLLHGKGLDVLLEAFARVAAARPELQLVLVGAGEGHLSAEESLRRRASVAPLAGRVRFAGRAERVEDWLRASDLFVFPSLFEGLGISLVEAASCGLPSIGSRTGGIPDVIEDGVSGLLVPPGDPGALAATLASLAADGERRAAMGREARRIGLERFERGDAVARYRALFAEVSSRSTAARPGRAPRAGAGSPPSPAARA
jgi:glycosyltransferase involved in cell wall biosynthesis